MTNPQNQLDQIYNSYLNSICPLITIYEVLAGNCPVAIMNEIRALFTHLARDYTTKEPDIKEKEIHSAQRHLERILRDCFKYVCLAYEDQYREFILTYAHIDLTRVDNGDFLPVFKSCYTEAKNLFLEARKLEHCNTDDIAIRNAYELAFVAYTKMYALISGNNISKFVHIRRKMAIREKLNYGIGILGLIGSLITIYSFLFSGN